MKVTIRFQQLVEDAVIPTKESEGAAGWDMHAAYADILYPGETRVIPMGFALAIPPGFEGQVRSRSGMSLRGIQVANSPGTIDSDFRGEVGVILRNTSDDPLVIEPGMRLAQLIIKETVTVTFEEVRHLDQTERGSGGFGSTGV